MYAWDYTGLYDRSSGEWTLITLECSHAAKKGTMFSKIS